MKRLLWAAFLFGVAGLAQLGATPAAQQTATDARVHTYYIAAEETDWDYAPIGVDMMTGKPFEGTAAAYTQPGPDHIGHVYRKALYREYTDATFATRKPRAAEDEYLGLLGPTLRAEVGDTIKVVFKNNASRPYGIHAPDVFRLRNGSAGDIPDATGNIVDTPPEDRVEPGATFTYEWDVSQSAGPDPGDPSSIAWIYNSHNNENRDVASGLIGAAIVTARGQANADGTPKDVDREMVALFNVFNENESWYIQENVAAHISAADQKDLAEKGSANFSDSRGYFTFTGTGFVETNYKFSVNGYLYGDGPVMTVRQGQRVRWYLLNMGNVGALNFHTPHWHGNTVLSHGTRRDTISVLPLGTETADMVPDAPGLWLFHCHIDDHMEAGMMARYEVLPAH
jgi:hephaestin